MIVHEAPQNTPEWLLARLGIPTASNAQKVVTSAGARSKSLADYAAYLAGCLYTKTDNEAWEGNIYTERGHELEDEARAAYEFEADLDVEVVGFCTTDDGRFGASPDGLVNERKGGVEIKCLPKKHITTLLYWHKHKKCPPERVAQVQMQIKVCELEWVDSYFYQPNLPSLMIRNYPDKAVQDALSKYLEECRQERDKILTVLEEMRSSHGN